MGAWSALILRSGIAKEKIMQLASFAAIAALAIFVIVIDRNPLTPFWGNTPMAVIGLTAVGLGFTSLLLQALYAPFDSGMRRMLRKQWLQFLGKYSYAIYIVHVPVVIMMDRLLAGQTGICYVAPFLLSVMSISVGLSLISWRVIEKPCLSLKDRFTT
jgi:peptidoglycan/LPS O-acetylase OafA/YrhL